MTQLLSPDPNSTLRGSTQTISHAGAGQYQYGSTSACGLAALNCARILFERQAGGLHGQALVDNLVSRPTTEEILSICPMWTTAAHCEIENVISNVPLFNRYMDLTHTAYDTPSFAGFRYLLGRIQEYEVDRHAAAVVITRPPEIVVCLAIPADWTVYYIVFDSHSRPAHPNGAGFIVSNSISGAARYLASIFPVDPMLLSDPSLGWQTQYLSQFSGHYLSPKQYPTQAVPEIVEETSRVILDLQSQVEQLKQRSQELSDNNSRLEGEIREAMKRHNRFSPVIPQRRYTPAQKGKQREIDPPLPSQFIPASPPRRKQKEKPQQNKNSERPPSLFAQFLSILPYWSDNVEPSSSSISSEEDNNKIDDFARNPVTFYCAVCLDDHDEEDAAYMGCGHTLCRDSLRSHIIVRLEGRTFPIYCPVCTAVDGKDPQDVDIAVIQQLGLSDKHAALFEELQMSPVSVQVDCRGCQSTLWLDREDYQRESILFCHSCYARWCKECSQIVEFGGPEHSCDGTKELDFLMNEQKWRYCPGCKTPIQKEDGCNHMTCKAPGCTVHFCWVCGKVIVQSTINEEISRALTNHFASCSLFDNIPPDVGSPP